MGDEVNQLREAARQAIDAFIDNRVHQLVDYIDGEQNMQTLQNVLNQLTLINNNVVNPALFAGEVAQEILNPEELNEVRDVARAAVNTVINDDMPLVLDTINALNNMQALQRAIDELNDIIAAITDPALIA